MYLKSFIICCLLGVSSAQDEVNNKLFPKEFMFGAATASYQIEGGWSEDGKGENIWDHYIHNNPNLVADRSNGDITCDSYHKYTQDIAILKELGVQFYRFSLSWARILPNGTTNNINLAGISYYRDLIKELKNNGIEPMVTLYHWDLPQQLQAIGGWVSEFIIEYYAEYAKFCFGLFGDDVKYWLTFNEPKQICLGGYGKASDAPGINTLGIGEYTCAHNLLRAHAKAWRIYDEEFRSTQNGKVSITIDTMWYKPDTDSDVNQEAAERALQFEYGWFANPIYKSDYPEIMKTRIARRSTVEGFTESRLPTFTEDEIADISGTFDFMGVNMYTSSLVIALPEVPVGQPSYYFDVGVITYQPDNWEGCSLSWLKVTPWGIRDLMNWLKDTYNNPPIIITENGIADYGASLNDTQRINYYKNYLSNVRSAIEDGVNILGYTAWSLMDSFEWREGYTQKFGLYSVDFTNVNRTRTAKSSAAYYKTVIETRCLVETCEE